MDNPKIIAMLHEQQLLRQRLDCLIYGAPEIRTRNTKKYIYVNYREDGKKICRYVGEFSQELLDTLLENTAEAKALKKSLRALEKELEKLGVNDWVLPEKTKLAIDFARRNLVNSITGQAVLEGIATTAAETEEIIAGLRVQGISDESARKILNLKHAWDFALSEFVILSEQNVGLLSQINKLVEEGFYYNAGKLRGVPVKIGGTDWCPELPIESKIKEELTEILATHKSKAEIGIDLLLYVMKKQIFIDGNKRTALIFANHYLVANGVGVIFIDETTTDQYKRLLIEYYETGEKKAIIEFLDKTLIRLK